ncbi:hypothetical protein DM860_004821 [Cuscuta australis]|uniref:Thioredoxin domain-containing protein n=1 Tax=Cuscuta australis TaxID=267555 RepID=A0A328DLH4_9ASTE|nr:hypothetical protein DM860_004821 [Cuscuta australis]
MAREGKVISCHTVTAWNEELCKGMHEKKLMVVDFTATWCSPCRTMGPVFSELARTTPDVIFLKVDVDELHTVASDWGIEGMPTFMFLKEGKILGSLVGAKKDELQKLLAKHTFKNASFSKFMNNAHYYYNYS